LRWSRTEPPASSARSSRRRGSAAISTVVVSAELGVGKPEPEIFEAALDRLGAAPGEAAMVGDTIDRDIAGATAAGLAAIWLNRAGRPAPPEAAPPVEIRGLSELPAAVERL
jgi:putative hydrolase of the HAD superfamily